jgi:hypothetical protein
MPKKQKKSSKLIITLLPNGNLQLEREGQVSYKKALETLLYMAKHIIREESLGNTAEANFVKASQYFLNEVINA